MVQSSLETEVTAESGVHYPRSVNTSSFHITFHHVLHSERMNIDWCCSKECEGCRVYFFFFPVPLDKVKAAVLLLHPALLLLLLQQHHTQNIGTAVIFLARCSIFQNVQLFL